MTSYKLQAGIYIPEIISKYDGKVELSYLLFDISRNVKKCFSDVIVFLFQIIGKQYWQRWDSNPRLQRDWSLNPAP